MGGKRPNENDNFHHDEIVEPLGKMERIELDDSDDESSVCLHSDLNNFVGKYARKHIGDKDIKECVMMDNSVPANVDKPTAVDIHIKELIKETVSGNGTLSVDGIFFSILNIYMHV